MRKLALERKYTTRLPRLTQQHDVVVGSPSFQVRGLRSSVGAGLALAGYQDRAAGGDALARVIGEGVQDAGNRSVRSQDAHDHDCNDR